MKYEIITIRKTDELYPKSLLQIGDEAPEVLYAMGNTNLLKRTDMVAIIGARKATQKGCEAAYQLGVKYAREGRVVVSGLALGCDAAAHRGCLAAQGETIAIVATGLNLVHPRENTQLQEQILARRGLILSEQPLGTKANPTRLVARNRLQAGMSTRVIVAECPEHSGTMHTVRFTEKYQRELTAVRLPYTNDNNSGNTLLLTTGRAQEELMS